MVRRYKKLTNAQWEERKRLRKQAFAHAQEMQLVQEDVPVYGPPRPPMLFGYIRCSHLDSVESGMGIEAQRRLITRWAEFLRETNPELGEIVWIEEQKIIQRANNAISAYRVELIRRPGGRMLNQQLRNGDHVVFAYLDRAWRNTEDCLATLRRWNKRGVTAHFANMRIDTKSAQGKLLLTVLAAAAEMDSHMKSERIKEVMSAMPALGRLANGHAPIGYKLLGKKGLNRAVVPDHDQRIIMAEIARFVESGRPTRYHGRPGLRTWEEVLAYIVPWMDDRERAEGRNPFLKKPLTKERCKRFYEAELLLREKRSQKEKRA